MRRRAIPGHGKRAYPDYAGELDPVDASISDANAIDAMAGNSEIDAAILEAYRESLENPPTPESLERLRRRMFGLLAKYTWEDVCNGVTDCGDEDATGRGLE